MPVAVGAQSARIQDEDRVAAREARRGGPADVLGPDPGRARAVRCINPCNRNESGGQDDEASERQKEPRTTNRGENRPFRFGALGNGGLLRQDLVRELSCGQRLNVKVPRQLSTT